MIEKVLQWIFILLFVVSGLAISTQVLPIWREMVVDSFLLNSVFGVTILTVINSLVGIFAGFLLGRLISPFLFNRLKSFTIWVDRTVADISIPELMLGLIGLFLGLIIANLFGLAFSSLPVVGPYVSIALSIILGYTGMQLAVSQRTQIVTLYNNIRQGRYRDDDFSDGIYGKILDTSVIIDGRIADIAETGFLDGPLVVPVFVLEELQHIADSADVLKRNRGRRGLDILNQLQKKKVIEIRIVTEDFPDIHEVDSKLVQLGLAHKAPLVTNDYNLNKVAELQGVKILNINQLANSVKPVLIPGESIMVRILKQGKEENQGIAYLGDGTMIVVEYGSDKIGMEVEVVVASVLQTGAGKMIFAKLV